MRIQVREVGQRVQRLEFIPGIEPVGHQMCDLSLHELKAVREIKIPRHQQVDQQRQKRIGAHTQRSSKTAQSSHFN